jgi:hypothetical protein
MLLDRCKGTNKRAQNKTKKDFFVFIVEREYFRALLKGTNKRAKNQIFYKNIICRFYFCPSGES